MNVFKEIIIPIIKKILDFLGGGKITKYNYKNVKNQSNIDLSGNNNQVINGDSIKENNISNIGINRR